MHRSQGFSLLEMLLASSLSAIIILAMLNLFIWSQKNIVQQQSLLTAINKIRFINSYLRQSVATGEILHVMDNGFEVLTQSGKKLCFFIAKIHTHQAQPTFALFQTSNQGRRQELIRPLYKMQVQKMKNKLNIAFGLRSAKKILHHHYALYQWKLTLP